jgi:hypothetical protein
MTMVARLGLPDCASASPITARPAPPAGPEFDLVACLRGLDGWVAPDGLAPRAAFERLAERGLLEAWPNRPLYRAPRNTTPVRAETAR